MMSIPLNNPATRLLAAMSARIVCLVLVVGALLRLVLTCITSGPMEISIGGWLEVFALGAVNDLCVAVVSLLFLWLYVLTLGTCKYGRWIGGILFVLLSAAFVYVVSCNTVFHEYGSVVPLIAAILFGFWAVGFGLRLFLPAIRPYWTRVWLWIILGLYVFVIYFNAVSEFFFWNEFSVRYNFIAVDYLIYTNEVIGNIMESYAIVPLFAAVTVCGALTAWFLFRSLVPRVDDLLRYRWKWPVSVLYVAAAVLSVWLLTFNVRFQQTPNTYLNELQANGVYKFIDAFRKNHLDFESFYVTLPDAEAGDMVREMYGSTGENRRYIVADSTAVWPEGARPNIVVITMESMSADFMERYGDGRHITPNLDSLARRSLVFDNMIATGNRTVRGLEAITLSLPPCPGESIIKRPDCAGFYSVATVLDSLGYTPYYFYGGNAYFDNMGTFFGGNGYKVIDSKYYRPDEITFSNIWGVADEDSYRKAIATLDTISSASGPFFAHIMTISNHRPYTYPEGRIPIPTDSKTREGGVMYSDYALGRFFAEAEGSPWFSNTVFVVLADHCASSAGRTNLPLEKYHIPAMIYAPGVIEPRAVEAVVSQIDVMPTLFALLGFSYESQFFGRNVLASDYEPRAFLATYENLGYLQDSILTVLSPIRRVEQLRVTPVAGNPYETTPVAEIDTAHVRRATALFQTSSAWNHPDTRLRRNQ